MRNTKVKLSSSQERTLRAIGYGLSRSEVAVSLDVSPEQVDRNVAQAYRKLHMLEKQCHDQPKLQTVTAVVSR